MATISHFESLSWPYEKFSTYLSSSDFPAFETLMIIEGKLTTATSLSAARYILMNCLSANRDPSACMDKVDQPIRSRLHLYGLHRLILFTKTMDQIPSNMFSRLKKVHIDDDEGLFNIGMDLEVTMPPVFSRFTIGRIPLRMAICEIYLHMTYHKDRANPTHDERRILQKILKCQYKYADTEFKEELYGIKTGLDHSEYARRVMEGKAGEFRYSAKAVSIGSKLIRLQHEHRSKSRDPYSPLYNHASIDFHFTDLEQFKASVPSWAQQQEVGSRPPQLSVSKNPWHRVDPELQRLIPSEGPLTIKNSRTHVIMSLLQLFSVAGLGDGSAPGFISNIESLTPLFRQVYCQLFKKNQITGVREIHILDIVSRCFVRLRENISRRICNLDRREMLTSGDRKFSVIRSEMRKMVKGCPEGLIPNIFHMSEDMTTWAQQFQIPSFNHLLMPHSNEFSLVHSWSKLILEKFMTKKIELPSHLLKELLRFPNRLYTDDDLNEINRLKNETHGKLRRGENYGVIENGIGMWMGILHYTSSHYHLALISLIQEVFNRCLSRKFSASHPNILELVKHNSYVSSDDRYRILVVYSNDKILVREVLELYETVSANLNRLFNIKLSSKSATGPLIGEFNSVFFTYETYLSATIKFATQCCALNNTDAAEEYIHQSYSSVRSAFENGLSVTGCMVAHMMNVERFYWIFQTGEGQVNDLKKLYGENWNSLPYQVGIYPLYSPALMVISPPEMHNYMNLKIAIQDGDTRMSRIYSNIYTISSSFTDQVGANRTTSGDLPQTISIKIMTASSDRLDRYRKKIETTEADLIQRLDEMPLAQFIKSETIKDEKFKMHSTILSRSAEDAMKSQRKLLFFGRVGAYASAECFTLSAQQSSKSKGPTGVVSTGKTYREILQEIVSTAPIEHIQTQDDLITYFPTIRTFESLEPYYHEPPANRIRDTPRTMMSYRELRISDDYYELSLPIVQVISHAWFKVAINEGEEGRYERSTQTIKRTCPWYRQESLSETLRTLSVDQSNTRAVQRVIKHLVSKFSKKLNRTMKCFVYGPSSSTMLTTVSNIYKYNYAPSKTMTLNQDPVTQQKYYDDVSPALMIANLLYYTTKMQTDVMMSELDMMEANGREAMTFIQDALTNSYLNSRITQDARIILVSLVIMSQVDHDTKRRIIETLDVPIHTWVRKNNFNMETKEWERGPWTMAITYRASTYTVSGDEYVREILCHPRSSRVSHDLWMVYEHARQMTGSRPDPPPARRTRNYLVREDKHRRTGHVYPVNDRRDANITVTETKDESRHIYENILKHPASAFEIRQHGERFQLYCFDTQLMTARPKFSQVNDEQIGQKLIYRGDNESIHWLMKTNPFRHNVSMLNVRRHMKSEMLLQSEIELNPRDVHFARRFQIRTPDQAEEYKRNTPSEIIAIFQEGEVLQPELLLATNYEILYPDVLTTSSESEQESKQAPSREDQDFYEMMLKASEEMEGIDYGTPSPDDEALMDVDITTEFIDSVLPTFTRRQEMILTEGLGFYNRANLQVRLYMLDIFGTDRINSEPMIMCMIGMIKEKATTRIIDTHEKQMMAAIYKSLMKTAVAMNYHITTERIRASRVQPSMISKTYQRYFQTSDDVVGL
jgi:hypothetical protein